MLLYHGTSEPIARKILKSGLKPRLATGKSQWSNTVESSSDAIYLTDAYAPYFAMCATKSGQRIAIIEIDTSKLTQAKFQPDEDFLEQVSRGHDGIDLPMEARTEIYRDNLKKYQSKWKLSLQYMGTCSYKGTIPVSAITRVAIMKLRDNPKIMMTISDPSITILNYMVMKRKYRALTQWFFDDVDTTDLVDTVPGMNLDTITDPSTKDMLLKARQDNISAYKNKPVEIIDLRKSKSEGLINLSRS